MRTAISPLSRSFCTLGVIVAIMSSVGCQEGSSVPPIPEPLAPTLPHSFALPDQARVEHIDLDLEVDFEQHRLFGTANLAIVKSAQTTELRLDSEGLEIEEAWKISAAGERSQTLFVLGEPIEHLGRPLIVSIETDTQQVELRYRTSPDAAAIQWLTPAQTATKVHPFLFTQSQAILARTWVPCQDTPAVRFTYDAVVRVPPPLIALMSAENPTKRSADGVYRFSMSQPIPSYLLALAVGDLEFRAVGVNSGVYAEPTEVERSAWEFAETEAMMEAAGALYGPYRWGRYDILVLPPSFPFGGMENPRLTFATPTILAGDRSLVSLIAHELAHSWSGNLVTNATWNDFWLNEGFTVYLERRIMEAIHGREYAEMLALLGAQDLEVEVADLGATSADTHLMLDLDGRNPDDGMTDIAYEKGYLLLRLLEETVGREAWDAFLLDYFENYAFRSLTTAEFVEYLGAHLDLDIDELETIRLDEWLNGPGIPNNVPTIESGAFAVVDSARESWLGGNAATSLATAEWSTHEWLHFLRGLPASLPQQRLEELDTSFGFTTSGNSEILHAWLHHVITNRYQVAYPAVEAFLEGMGRRKFLEPIYRRLAETDDGMKWAHEIYARARPSYHSVSAATIDSILGWKQPAG